MGNPLASMSDAELLGSGSPVSTMSDDELLSHGQADAPEGASKLESGLRGAAQGMTFNHEAPVEASLRAAYDKVRGAHEDLGALYARHRKEADDANDAAQKKNPLTYGGANIAGGLVPFAIPGLGELALPARVATYIGAGMADASGAMHDDFNNPDYWKHVAEGGAMGGAGGAMGELAGKAVAAAAKKLQPAAEDAGEWLSQKAVGGGGTINAKVAPDAGAGRAAFDAGTFENAPTLKRMSTRLASAKEAAGNEVGAASNALDEAGVKVPTSAITGPLDTAAAEAARGFGPGGKPGGGQLRNMSETVKGLTPEGAGGVNPRAADAAKLRAVLEKEGTPELVIQKALRDNGLADVAEGAADTAADEGTQHLSFNDALKVKRSAQDRNNYSATDPGIAQQEGREGANIIRTATERAAQQQGTPEAAGRFLNANKKFAPLAQMSDLAENSLNRAGAHRIVGMSDLLPLAAGFSHNPLLAVPAFAAKKALWARGPSFATQMAFRGSDALKDIVMRDPARLGKYGVVLQNALRKSPSHFAAANMLLSQTDPSYQALMAHVQDGGHAGQGKGQNSGPADTEDTGAAEEAGEGE